MNSTYMVGIGALILTGIFYRQLDDLPSVAQRLPGLLIWIVAILAVLMVIEEALKQRRLRNAPADPSLAASAAESDELAGAPTAAEDDDPPPSPIHWKAFASFSAALIAYVWLIPTVGYIITTILFLAGVLLFSRTIRPISAVLISLGLTAFVWLVFIWALGLPVPLLPWLG